MTQSAVILLCTIVGAFGVLMGGIAMCLRVLWGIRGSWDATNTELRLLVERVATLVTLKDADNARLNKRDEEIAGRLERHLEWHDKH